MAQHVPADARIMLCQFRGDPHADIRGKWRAKPLDNLELIDPLANVYLTVAAMKRNAAGEFRRRKDNFAGGLLLMIDDLGSGPGSKFSLNLVEPLPPTALIETSPKNYQAVYMFRELVTNINEFEALIRAFIARQFLGQDTGMAGVNRVFRPPAGVNGKPKYGGWKVGLAEWRPGARYDVGDLVKAFSLDLHPRGAIVPRGATVNKADQLRAFGNVQNELRLAGMLKDEEPNMDGWQAIHCPWRANHTAEADNGAGIRMPADENGWVGAFRCHHASCEGKGWRDLTEWLAEQQLDVLTDVNNTAPQRWFI